MSTATQALSRLQAMLEASEAQPAYERPSVVPSRVLDARLRDYQVQAVHHLWSHRYAGLFMEMGLGKTASVLQALLPQHGPVLVIAPKRVVEKVWPQEAAMWRPDLSVSVAVGTPAKRAAALAAGADLTVISRDNINDIEPGQFRTLVLDELSVYKGRGARWKAASKISAKADYVWGLTGTPSPNGYMDLWPQVYLLDGGKALGRTLGSADPRFGPPKPDSFRGRFFYAARVHRTSGVIIEWGFKDGAQEKIEQAMAPFCLSMKSAEYLPDLPPVILNEVKISLDPKSQKVYDQMVATLVTQVKDQTHTAGSAAIMTGKLSQITAGFLYGEDDEPTSEIHKIKTTAAREVVEEGNGSPVLVFYRFQHERDALLASLPGARLIDDGDAIEAWNRGEVPVLLAHPASAGHGLNLQHGGHTILWTTMPWSLEEWDQANARLARQGQTNPVVVHMLLVEDSVDEAIQARLTKKASVQEALMMALKA